MYYQLNPFLLIFLSYGLGVLATEFVKILGFYHRFKDQHYISDQMTKQLGVLILGWLIRHSFMGRFNQKLVYRGKGNKVALQKLMEDMTYAENNHLWSFILLSLFIMLMPVWGIGWWYVILMIVINIIFNLYLVFLQQYNKRRIGRILNRLHY